jgi:hypothetical protein
LYHVLIVRTTVEGKPQAFIASKQIYRRLLFRGVTWFDRFNFEALTFYAEANAAKNAHVEIGNPHQGKTRNEITAPIIEQKLISRDKEKKRGHVVAEAVFTSEQVEELPLEEFPAHLTVPGAPVARFAKYFLMGNRPGDGGDRESDYEQFRYLFADRCHMLSPSLSRMF